MKLSEIEDVFEDKAYDYFYGGIYKKFYKKEFNKIKNGELMGMIFDGLSGVNVLAPEVIFSYEFNYDLIQYIYQIIDKRNKPK